MKKPHIIIFNPDEMRADSLYHLGNPAAITPNLDAFAANEAVSFSNAYCQNPVCVPSRCSFFTGLYPHTKGHRTMSYLLHPGETSLFSELKNAGYYVWMNTRNDLFAGQIKGWCEENANEIFYPETIDSPGPVNPNQRGEKGGKWYYSHFRGKLALDENGRNYNKDDADVDAAIERLTHPIDDRPMCVFMGLFYPHPAYCVEEPYFSAIDRNKLPPRIKLEGSSGKSKMTHAMHDLANLEGNLSEADWDELRATYLGMVMKVDDQFGRLISALKKEGIYDDCAIFVLSDHGDFTGDYGCVEKPQNDFEDCLIRVPFLVKPPKGIEYTPGISDSFIELVDFYATVMDFADVEPDHTHFGKSIRPILQQHDLPHREYVYCEGGRIPGEICADEYHSYGPRGSSEESDYWPKMISQTDDIKHEKGIMMRGKRFKYVSRILEDDELYDLLNDPEEKCNVIDNPEFAETVSKMRNTMLKWLEYTGDTVPLKLDSRFSAEMLFSNFKRNVDPECYDELRKKIEEKPDIFEVIKFVETHTKKGHNNVGEDNG